MNNFTHLSAKLYRVAVLASIFSLYSPIANAEIPLENLQNIRNAASTLLKQKLSELDGKSSVEVGKLDERLRLRKCSNLSAELTTGSRLVGKATVSISCSHPEKWNIFVTARTSLISKYIISTQTILPGSIINEYSLDTAEGDLGVLPANIARNASQVIGLSSTSQIRRGEPIRTDTLVKPLAFQAGQQITIVVKTAGFSVTGTGIAVNSARIDAIGEARLTNGQRITGKATALGTLEIGT